MLQVFPKEEWKAKFITFIDARGLSLPSIPDLAKCWKRAAVGGASASPTAAASCCSRTEGMVAARKHPLRRHRDGSSRRTFPRPCVRHHPEHGRRPATALQRVGRLAALVLGSRSLPLPCSMETTISTAGMPLPAGLGIPTLASTFALALTSLGDPSLRTAVARTGVPACRSRPSQPRWGWSVFGSSKGQDASYPSTDVVHSSAPSSPRLTGKPSPASHG